MKLVNFTTIKKEMTIPTGYHSQKEINTMCHFSYLAMETFEGVDCTYLLLWAKCLYQWTSNTSAAAATASINLDNHDYI